MHGAELIPVRELVLPGETEKQRVHEDFQAMDSRSGSPRRWPSARWGCTVTIRHLGALVEQVTPGLPAAKAGVQAGEVITAVNGHKVRSGADLIRRPPALHPGDAAPTRSPQRGTRHLRTVAQHRGSTRRSSASPIADDVRITHMPVHVHYSTQRHRRPVRGARVHARDLRQPERPPPAATATASPSPARSTWTAT